MCPGGLGGQLLQLLRGQRRAWNAANIAEYRTTAKSEMYKWIARDVAHVAGTSLVRKHSDYFVKQISKLDEIICEACQSGENEANLIECDAGCGRERTRHCAARTARRR